MQKEPAIKKLLQVSMVVDDLEAYVKRYNDEYGIGPWHILEFDENSVKKMHINGEDAKWGIKLAFCDSLNVQLEFIEPTYGESPYMTFLREHGPGLHHIYADTEPGFMSKMVGKGYTPIVGGEERGGRKFNYLDLGKELGCIMEFIEDPPDVELMTGKRYPPEDP